MSTFIETNPEPIANCSQLTAYFTEACKPKKMWKVGGEYEKLGVFSDTKKAIFYTQIAQILKGLIDRYQWEPVFEKETIIALTKKGASITFEPGCQLELSGLPFRTLDETKEEFNTHQRELQSVSQEIGVIWLGIGAHPIASLSEIPWFPKSRYEVMAPFMLKQGEYSHHMMKKTATIQANFDYSSETDAMEKLRVAMGITSIVTALFSNSPLTEGNPNNHLSWRSAIWLETDTTRSGLLREVFELNFSFKHYVEYALDVPMIFIQRGNDWIGMDGISFRTFLKKGYKKHTATFSDWYLHLSTLFPEVRLRRYIEVRGADSLPPPLALSVGALWKGILYEKKGLESAWEMVQSFSWEERVLYHKEVCQKGLLATFGKYKGLDLAKDLIAIAKEGLSTFIPGEERYLDPIESFLADHKSSPGDLLLKEWAKGGTLWPTYWTY